jgi:hypothetical protein
LLKDGPLVSDYVELLLFLRVKLDVIRKKMIGECYLPLALSPPKLIQLKSVPSRVVVIDGKK